MTDLNEVVGGYTLVRPLGSGSQGTTFVATSPDGGQVVLKEFSIAAMRGWKSLELFQREIATLTMLDHPNIPGFVDDVEADGAHYLIQEFIDGEVLSEVADRGALPEDELRRVARDILEVLVYLHELNPPVVHRDVKPSNIIRRPDGSHALVDFGGVQMIVAQDTGGSTVIGTTGYMPSEQLVGRAVPQSDLYALGATLAHLATGISPSELPTKRLRVDWRPSAGEMSDQFGALIDQMLEPAPEDRPESAAQTLGLLTGSGMLVAADDGGRQLSPEIAALEARIHRSRKQLEVTLEPGAPWLWPTSAVVASGALAAGVVMSSAVHNAILFMLVFMLLAYTVVRNIGLDALVIRANGTTDLRFHDEDGAAQEIRGVLEFEDGELFVQDDLQNRIPVHESLTSEQALWLAAEATQFVEQSARVAKLLQSAPPPDEGYVVAGAEVTENGEAPPEEPEETRAFVDALPDHESKFDLTTTVEPEQPVVPAQDESFFALPSAARPTSECPPRTLDRVQRGSGMVTFDLRPKFDRTNVILGTVFALIGVIVWLVTRTFEPVVVGACLALYSLLSSTLSMSREKLTIYRDGSFLLSTNEGGHAVTEKGKLIPEARMSDSNIRLRSEQGDHLALGGWLNVEERVWIAYLMNQTLEGEDDF